MMGGIAATIAILTVVLAAGMSFCAVFRDVLVPMGAFTVGGAICYIIATLDRRANQRRIPCARSGTD